MTPWELRTGTPSVPGSTMQGAFHSGLQHSDDVRHEGVKQLTPGAATARGTAHRLVVLGHFRVSTQQAMDFQQDWKQKVNIPTAVTYVCAHVHTHTGALKKMEVTGQVM